MLTYNVSCATVNGIDKTVVERAEDLCLLCARGEDLVAACATLSKKDESNLQVAVGAAWQWRITAEFFKEDTARSFLSEDIRDLASTGNESATFGDSRSFLGTLV